MLPDASCHTNALSGKSLEAAVKAKGLTVFAHVDHAAGGAESLALVKSK